jgi:hypothetical protein
MKLLKRIRTIALSALIFGAFANFAQNGWGHTVMKTSELCLALIFLSEFILINTVKRPAGVSPFASLVYLVGLVVGLILGAILIKRVEEDSEGILLLVSLLLFGFSLFPLSGFLFRVFKKRNPESREMTLVEPLIFFMVFLGLWAAWEIAIVVGVMFIGFPFYLINTVRFFRQNVHSNRNSAILYLILSIVCIFMGFGYLFRILYFPGFRIFFSLGLYSYLLLLPFVILFMMNRVYRESIKAGFSFFPGKLFLVLLLVSIFYSYGFLTDMKLIPPFYEHRFPLEVDKIHQDAARLNNEKKWHEFHEINSTYRDFIKQAKKANLLE